MAESKKVQSLIQGSAGLSAPASVTQDDSFSVVLRVAPTPLAPILDSLRSEHPGATVVGRENIKVTSRMTARLAGFGVVIEPKDAHTYPVVAGEATTWQWRVKAEEAGTITLLATLSGTVQIEGKEVEMSPVSYEQKIVVAVSPMAVVKKNWQWGFSALLFPAMGALWALYGKRREPTRPAFTD